MAKLFHTEYRHLPHTHSLFVRRNPSISPTAIFKRRSKFQTELITQNWRLSWPSSGPAFRVIWLWKMPASGWGSLWESSSFVPWLSTFVFRNVSGTVPDCVRICWFRRNSSNLNRAPKMRDFVLLYSLDSFLVTLPLFSSETCVVNSSLISGTDVFRDWPFLGCSSCVSLVTAAYFRLFLNVAIFWREKVTQLWRLN